MDQSEIMSGMAVNRTFIHTLLLCCGFIGSMLFNIIYFTLSAVSPHYDMMQQPIGDLQLLHQGWIQSANYIMLGLFTCAFAAGLYKEMSAGGIGAILISLFHALTGLGLVLSGIFSFGPEHTFAGSVTFLSLMISFFLLAARFAKNDQWNGWVIYTILSVILMLLFACVFKYVQNAGGRYAGILERLVVVVRLVWLLFFTIKLFDGKRFA